MIYKFTISIVFIVVLASFLAIASATALTGATCTVTAEVIDSVNVKQSLEPNNQSIVTTNFLQIKILTAQKIGFYGDCSFVKKDDIFRANSSVLTLGDKFEVNLEKTSSLGSTGTVDQFIHWDKITLLNDSRSTEGLFLDTSVMAENIADTPDVSQSKNNQILLKILYYPSATIVVLIILFAILKRTGKII